MKPRIIFIDLHSTNFLCRTYSDIRSGRKVKTYKHQYVVRHFLNNGYKVYNLTSGNLFINDTVWGKIKSKIRNLIVYYKNGLHGIKEISDINKIKETDIVVGYLVYKHQEILKKINCYKVLFGNHFISINESINLHELGINAFVNEIDLSKNDFINRYLGITSVDSLIIPYTFQQRFIDKKNFKERENKMMAVGTSSTCSIVPNEYKLYREYFNTELIQPMRQKIYEKQDSLKEYIDCYISSILEDNGNQTKYTSFDMVETFNRYRMFACPEELVGMPGIGFVEGMACGTAYIGLDHDMYRCLGLVPGVHYISYDGTLKNMMEVIKEYQSKPEELAKIAKAGTDYVRSHFNQEAVSKSFEEQLLNSYNKYLTK